MPDNEIDISKTTLSPPGPESVPAVEPKSYDDLTPDVKLSIMGRILLGWTDANGVRHSGMTESQKTTNWILRYILLPLAVYNAGTTSTTKDILVNAIHSLAGSVGIIWP